MNEIERRKNIASRKAASDASSSASVKSGSRRMPLKEQNEEPGLSNKTTKKNTAKTPSRVWSVTKWLLIIGVSVGTLAFLVFLYFFVPMYRKAGQELEGKDIHAIFRMEGQKRGIVTQDGKVLVDTGEQKPEWVEYKDLDPQAVKALLATEDQNYFSWWRKVVPVDPIGILRAVKINAEAGEVRAGGSTIIQMLARLFVGREKTGSRKLWELAYSMQFVKRYSLEDLLAVFMCRADFGAVNGQPVVGFKQASRAFYQKELKELSLDELGVVVGVLNATTAFNPVYHPETSQKRRNKVFAAWVDAGFISKEKRAELEKLPVKASPQSVVTKYGEYPNAVKAALAEWETIAQKLRDSGVEVPPTEQLLIEVTYESSVLEAWKQAFLAEMSHLPAGMKAAGGVIDYRNGETLSMFGGTDFLNRFTTAQRQPGSVFKLFVYALALAKGDITPDTVFTDQARTFANPGSDDYTPSNHDGFSGKEMTVAQALADSKNVIACVVAEQLGYENIVAFARLLGLEIVKDGQGNLHPTPSITLGAYEVTMPQLLSALSIFANGGKQVPVHYIRKVTGPDGTVLYTADTTGVQRITAQVAAAMTNMMVGVAKFGTGKGIFSGLIALKTGSSRDGWLVGFTPGGLLFAIYVGYDNPQDHEVKDVYGATTAGKPAKNFLARLSKVENQKHWFAGTFPAMPSNEELAKVKADPVAVAKASESPMPTPAAQPQVSATPVASPTPTKTLEERANDVMIIDTSTPEGPKPGPTLKPASSSTPCANWKDCLKQSKQQPQGEVEPAPKPQAAKPSPVAKPAGTPDCATNWRGCVPKP